MRSSTPAALFLTLILCNDHLHAESKIWLSNASDLNPHTRHAGPFGEGSNWGDFGVPKPADDIYFHGGVWRPQFSGALEYPPPRTVVFGDMTVIYSGIGGSTIEYPGRDWEVNDVWVERGEYLFALGGQTLRTGGLFVRTAGESFPFTPTHHSSFPRRSLSVSNGNVSVGTNIQVTGEASFPAEFHVVNGARIETPGLYVGGFTDNVADVDSLLQISGIGSRIQISEDDQTVIAGKLEISDGGELTAEKNSVWDVLGTLKVSNGTMRTNGTDGRIRIFEQGESVFANNTEVILSDQFRCDGICTVEGGARFQSSGQRSGSNSSGLIGRHTPGVVSVTGQDSKWIQDGVLSVGWLASGSMNVLNGGSVESHLGVIGRLSGSTGRVTVQPGSNHQLTQWTVRESLSVGGTPSASGGVGELLVQNQNAVVDVGNRLTVRPGSSVDIISGGVLRVGDLGDRFDADGHSRLAVHEGSSVTVEPGGILRVGSAGLLPPDAPSDGIVIAEDGILNGDGILNANVFNAGIVSPGNSPGLLTINGNYQQSANGVLKFEFTGSDAGEYDMLHALGDAEISGAINLQFLNGFVPALGDSYKFLSSDGTLDLSQASFSIHGLAAGYDVALHTTAEGLTLQVVAIPEPSTLLLSFFGVLTGQLVFHGKAKKGPVQSAC